MGQGRGPCQVHPNEPVGARAGVGRVGQGVEVRGGAQLGEASADRLGRERRDPQALDRARATCGLVDVAEDQLALAAGVSRAHDLGGLSAAQDARHDVELLLRLARDDEGPALGQKRECLGRPAPPLGADLGGLGEAHEVADRPGHDVPVFPARSPRRARRRRGHGRGPVRRTASLRERRRSSAQDPRAPPSIAQDTDAAGPTSRDRVRSALSGLQLGTETCRSRRGPGTAASVASPKSL